MTSKTIVIGCDHAARALKAEILSHCESMGYTVLDVGTHSDASCDYPVIAVEAANHITEGNATHGILICGTGLGMSMSANKVNGIRCALCSEPYSAQMSREHNDANMLAIGARVVGTELAKMIVTTWLNAEFHGERHQRRVDMITAIENT